MAMAGTPESPLAPKRLAGLVPPELVKLAGTTDRLSSTVADAIDGAVEGAVAKAGGVVPQPSWSWGKSDAASEQHRAAGNRLFTANKFEAAVPHFTAAIATAESANSRAIALTNRSAACANLGWYLEALRDASEAVVASPEYGKAWYRRGMALAALAETPEDSAAGKELAGIASRLHAQGSSAKDAAAAAQLAALFPAVEKWCVSEADAELGVGPDALAIDCALVAKNPRISGAEASVAMAYSRSAGRYLLATQAIEAGIVVTSEYAYAAGLERQYRPTHCAYCLVEVKAPLSCAHCSYALYCSRACRSSDADHQRECHIPVVPYLPTSLLVALRSLVADYVGDCEKTTIMPVTAAVLHAQFAGGPQSLHSVGNPLGSSDPALYAALSEWKDHAWVKWGMMIGADGQPAVVLAVIQPPPVGPRRNTIDLAIQINPDVIFDWEAAGAAVVSFVTQLHGSVRCQVCIRTSASAVTSGLCQAGFAREGTMRRSFLPESGVEENEALLAFTGSSSYTHDSSATARLELHYNIISGFDYLNMALQAMAAVALLRKSADSWGWLAPTMWCHRVLQLMANVHAVTELASDDTRDEGDDSRDAGGLGIGHSSGPTESPRVGLISQRRVGQGLFLTGVLFNHSCDPNCVVRIRGRHLAVVTCKPIAVGDTVSISYGPVAARHALKWRRAQLLEQYGFVCTCAACGAPPPPNTAPPSASGGSTPVAASSEPLELKCFTAGCTGSVDRGRDKGPKRTTDSWALQCSVCGPLSPQQSEQLQRQEELAMKFELAARKALDVESPSEPQVAAAFSAVQQCLKIRRTIHVHTSLRLGQTEDMAARCCAEVGDYVGAIEFCERSLTCVTGRFGHGSVEAGSEWLKLAGLYIHAGEDAKARECAMAARIALTPLLVGHKDNVLAEDLQCVEEELGIHPAARSVNANDMSVEDLSEDEDDD